MEVIYPISSIEKPSAEALAQILIWYRAAFKDSTNQTTRAKKLKDFILAIRKKVNENKDNAPTWFGLLMNVILQDFYMDPNNSEFYTELWFTLLSSKTVPYEFYTNYFSYSRFLSYESCITDAEKQKFIQFLHAHFYAFKGLLSFPYFPEDDQDAAEIYPKIHNVTGQLVIVLSNLYKQIYEMAYSQVDENGCPIPGTSFNPDMDENKAERQEGDPNVPAPNPAFAETLSKLDEIFEILHNVLNMVPTNNLDNQAKEFLVLFEENFGRKLPFGEKFSRRAPYLRFKNKVRSTVKKFDLKQQRGYGDYQAQESYGQPEGGAVEGQPEGGYDGGYQARGRGGRGGGRGFGRGGRGGRGGFGRGGGRGGRGGRGYQQEEPQPEEVPQEEEQPQPEEVAQEEVAQEEQPQEEVAQEEEQPQEEEPVAQEEQPQEQSKEDFWGDEGLAQPAAAADSWGAEEEEVKPAPKAAPVQQSKPAPVPVQQPKPAPAVQQPKPAPAPAPVAEAKKPAPAPVADFWGSEEESGSASGDNWSEPAPVQAPVTKKPEVKAAPAPAPKQVSPAPAAPSVAEVKKPSPAPTSQEFWGEEEAENATAEDEWSEPAPAPKPVEVKKPSPAPVAEVKKPSPAPVAEVKKPSPAPVAEVKKATPVPAPKPTPAPAAKPAPVPAAVFEQKKPSPAPVAEVKKPTPVPAPKPAEVKKPAAPAPKNDFWADDGNEHAPAEEW